MARIFDWQLAQPVPSAGGIVVARLTLYRHNRRRILGKRMVAFIIETPDGLYVPWRFRAPVGFPPHHKFSEARKFLEDEFGL